MARSRRSSIVLSLAFLGISGLVAGAAAWGVFELLATFDAELETARTERPDDLLVVVAKKRLPPGHMIVADDLEEQPLRPEYVPANAMMHLPDIVGRTTKEAILPGDLMRSERLAKAESSSGLNAIIPQGMRAMSINVTGSSQVSGFINPGNKVDLLVTIFSDSGEMDESETNTMLQAAKVLAVDDRTEESQLRGVKLKPQVTLAVDPVMAERITHAVQEGRVKLVLRSDVDTAYFGERGVATSELLGGTESSTRMSVSEWRVAAGLEPAEPDRVEIIHGTEKVVEDAR